MTTPVVPARIAALPRDNHHRPIPWFVHRDKDGVPDFRILRRDNADAFRFDWCWVCGQPRGRLATFAIGPMCSVNRVAPEPPSHLECAMFSVQACPFLTTPRMRRRPVSTDHYPDQEQPPGVMIERNPGVTLLWTSRSWKRFRVPAAPGVGAGFLFDIGDPVETSWWAQGRSATRDEVLDSIDSGLPLLREQTRSDTERAALERMTETALQVVPA